MLTMIYNADSGLVNGAMDLLHKLVRPETYACRLCAVTYGTLGMKAEWRDFVARLPEPVEFLHRDEWLARFPGDATPLPAVVRVGDGRAVLVSAADFAGVATLEDFQRLLLARI